MAEERERARQGEGPPARPTVTVAGAGRERGSRLRDVAKAIGCLVLAVIVLGIAVVVGVFDILF